MWSDIMWNKKGVVNLLDRWVDYCALGCLALGFSLTLVAGSKVLSVIILLLAGMLVGRSIYVRKHKLQLRFWYIVSGFVVGLVVGSRFLTHKEVIVIFCIGAFVGHYIRKRGIFD